MLAVNFLVASVSIWTIIYINNKFLQPALKNKQRFKLYKLRDELSLLAMKGSLGENSTEYLILIRLINSGIKHTGSFKVTDYLHFILTFHKDKDLKEKFEFVAQKIEGADNRKYCIIASNTFQVMRDILYSDTRTLRSFFHPILYLLGGILSLFTIATLAEKVKKKKQVIQGMDRELGDFSDQFAQDCPAA